MDLAMLSDQIAAAVDRGGRSVVAVNARQHLSSSGVQWRPGIIVTAEHAIRRDDDITLGLPGGRNVPAKLAGRDPGADIAVLKADGLDLPAIERAPAGSARPGDIAIAVGRGLRSGVNAAMGIISAVAGTWRTWRGGSLDQLIRLDVALYPGISGGAALDHQGRVLGIATGALSRGAGIAVPASTVDRIADELLSLGRVRRGYLGVGLHAVALPDALARKLTLDAPRGLLVLTVEPGGPADEAGVMIGDILVGVDGKPVSDTDDVQAALGGESVGREVRVSIVRGGAKAELSATPRERPRAGG